MAKLALKITESNPNWEQNLLRALTAQNLWDKIGLHATGLISQRADQGRGYKGQLGEYSDGYKWKRRKAGKSVDKVYLQWDGTMMNALTHKVLGSGIGITAETRNELQKMRWLGIEGAGINRKTFDFLGFSDRDIEQMQEMIDDYVKRKTQ